MKPTSQSARLLKALADGKWHTTASLQRRSGAMRLNSRISDLRKDGWNIIHEGTAKSGALGHRYRLTNPPDADLLAMLADPPPAAVVLERSSVPRTPEHRYRIYRQVYEKIELLATATTPADVGEALIALGSEGVFNSSCVGILDTHGTEEGKGTWILNPWDVTP